MNWFARDDYRAIFETVSWDNKLFLESRRTDSQTPAIPLRRYGSFWSMRSSGRENLLHRAGGI